MEDHLQNTKIVSPVLILIFFSLQADLNRKDFSSCIAVCKKWHAYRYHLLLPQMLFKWRRFLYVPAETLNLLYEHHPDVFLEWWHLSLRFLATMGALVGFKKLVGRLDNKEKNLPKVLSDSFVFAVEYGRVDIVKFLLQDKRADPTCSSTTTSERNYAIRCAAKDNQLKIVELLLKDGRVDPTCSGNYPLGVAAAYGHIEMVRLLLQDKRVDPAARENHAVRVAAESGYWNVVELLLQASESVNGGQFVLKKAILAGRDDIAELIFNRGRQKNSLP